MIHVVDDRLLGEIARFRMVYTCDRCGQHDPEAGTCALGIPPAGHPARDPKAGEEMSFCKSFELW